MFPYLGRMAVRSTSFDDSSSGVMGRVLPEDADAGAWRSGEAANSRRAGRDEHAGHGTGTSVASRFRLVTELSAWVSMRSMAVVMSGSARWSLRPWAA